MCRELCECKCSQNAVMWQVATVAQANAKERAVPLHLLLSSFSRNLWNAA